MNSFDSILARILRLRNGRWLLLAIPLLITACGTPPEPAPPPPPACTPDTISQPCVCERAPDSPLCACLTNPPAEGCICLINPDAPQCKVSCPEGDTQAHIKSSLLLADDGEWDEARARIRCALDANPDSRRAQKIESEFEPGYFEREFPPVSVTYIVRSGDTLGSIARQCLNDTDLFVALALANDVKRPKSLNAGDKLTIYGTRSCVVQSVEVDPLKKALEAEQRGDYESANRWISQARARSPDDPEVIAASARISTAYVAQLRDLAYAAQDSGQANEARRHWKLILSIDPQNKEALFNLNLLDSQAAN